MRLHVDTDFAGNPDDACALAMVLGWPGAELIGITTTAEDEGRRAGYVRTFLAMLGVHDIPVAVGSPRSSSAGPAKQDLSALPDHDRFWPGVPRPLPCSRGNADAMDLLSWSIGSGATVVAIGPYTNLAELETTRPGALAGSRVVTMGGWVCPPGEGYPSWDPWRDRNVASDPSAARVLFGSSCRLTFVPCGAAIAASVRAADLPLLTATGQVGRLLAHQLRSHGDDADHPRLGRTHAALPDDLVGFLWDPVACAVALGWPGARVSEMTLRPAERGGALLFESSRNGRPTEVLDSVDSAAFTATWLDAVARAQR